MATKPSKYSFFTVLTDQDQQLLAGLLAKISNSLECAICSELMHIPFITSCGHSFCYECLTSWFQNKLNCPTCRKDLEQPPTLNVQLKTISRNITELLIDTNNEDKDEIIKSRESADAQYMQALENRSLFDEIFKRAITLIDNSDGVPRCGNCHWEAHGSVCLHCGTRFRIPMEDDYYDSDNGDAYDEDDEEDDRDLVRTANDVYDSEDSFIDERSMLDIEADLDDAGDILSSDEEEWGGFDQGEPASALNGEEEETEDLDQALRRFDDGGLAMSPQLVHSDEEEVASSRSTRRGRRTIEEEDDD